MTRSHATPGSNTQKEALKDAAITNGRTCMRYEPDIASLPKLYIDKLRMPARTFYRYLAMHLR